MTLTLAERPAIWWCVAVSGSRAWRLKWNAPIYRDLDEQLRRLRPGDTFALRHGGARDGADRIAHDWFASRAALHAPVELEADFGDIRDLVGHGIAMTEEIVEARWSDPCTETPYRDVRGNLVPACQPNCRKPSKGGRGDGETYCRAKGQQRNVEVVAHPEYPVDLLLAYCVNDSSGTTRTVGYAKRYQVNHALRAYYPKSAAQASRTARDGRGPRWRGGDGAHAGGGLPDVELAGSQR